MKEATIHQPPNHSLFDRMPTKRTRTAPSTNTHSIHVHLNGVQLSSPGAGTSSSLGAEASLPLSTEASTSARRPIPYRPTAYMDLWSICPTPEPVRSTQEEETETATVTENKEN